MSFKVNNRMKLRPSGSPLNILTAPTHERYESHLAQTGHNFFAIRVPGILKDWNTTFAPVPANYGLLDPTKKPVPASEDSLVNLLQQLPPGIKFDLVLSQNRFGQFQILSSLAKYLNLPLVSLEHTLPMSFWDKKKMSSLKQMKGDFNVFISEYSRGQWGYEGQADVIHHGLDTEVFKNNEGDRGPFALSVVNDWVNRNGPCGFKLWEGMVREGKFPVRVVGDTPGLSKPASSVADLVGEYNRASVFLNTSLISPVPTALLEAMSCGCAPVTTNTCMIPEVIQHGVNGYLFDPSKPQDGIALTKELLSDSVKAREMGKAARQTILDKFSLRSFLKNWNSLFDKVVS